MDNPTRRSGLERRQYNKYVDANKREVPDRRRVVRDFESIIDSLDTIPVFSGLTRDQYRHLIYICYEKSHPVGTVLLRQGSRAESFHILMKGELNVYRAETLVKHVFPVGIVGEVGVFSSKDHLTTAVTARDSETIQVNRTELFRLFRKDVQMSNRVLFNVIREIAHKFQEYNEIVEELQAVSRNIIV